MCTRFAFDILNKPNGGLRLAHPGRPDSTLFLSGTKG